MREAIVYLDSSAIIKRYINEPGSNTVRSIYRKAYTGDLKIAYSVWNIGEVLGAFDRARRLGRITSDEYRLVKGRFLSEAKRMVKLGIAIIQPIRLSILKISWKLVEKHHIYVADALQIASAKNVGAGKFLTGDEKLHETALAEGLASICLA